MKRCTECALLFENSQTHCPQCGRLLVKDKKSSCGDRAGCYLRGSDFFFSDYSVVHTIL